MWIEKDPEINDTVKIEFAKWTKLGTRIGVLVRISIDGWRVIDMGNHKIYLDRFTSFLVYQN